jgi:PAS domain S-box-containing protein
MLNTEPVRREEGAIEGCVITFTDVTETISTREKLNLLSRVIRETSNLVVITDPEERITWANESFLRTSGYDLAEATGRKPGELLRGPAKSREEIKKIKAALGRGEAVSGEILNYTKQGTSFWASYNIHPVKDEEGKVIRFFSIQSDITELKAMRKKMLEQQLAHQEQLGQAALEAQEKKQTEIGQELHDNVNQILAATKMYLGPIIKGERNVRENAIAVDGYIQLAIEEIRKLSHQLVAPRFKERKSQGRIRATRPSPWAGSDH